jgi:TldD protein
LDSLGRRVKDLLRNLMDSAARRAEYADARFVRTRAEKLSTRNGALDQLDSHESEGVGVRVRVGGAWGFAAARGEDRRDAEAALERALAVAAAQPAATGAALAPEPPARGLWENPVERDPFAVPLEDKLAVLAATDAGLRTEPGVNLTLAGFEALRVEKLFASTEGALCEQRVTECGGGISAVAVDGDESQVRSYPASHGGHVAQGGYEHFLALDLPGAAPRVSHEAVALLSAPPCPADRTTLILAGEQLGLQVHESVGHAVELDRVLGREASYAGTSFVPAEGLGTFRIGSEHVNVTADATSPGGLGSYLWDDEGVKARPLPIVREGVLAGFLSSRETAAEIGLDRSGGCMRAEGFARQPIVRMTNVNLDPGDAGTLADLVADTDDGLLIETNRSWSIDNRRLNFQFEGEAAWEIKNGRAGRLLRNPSYAGLTPEFWAGCDAVCSANDWRLISLLDCGKGEPGQVMRVSHGSAPARFRGVQVGVA